MSTIALHRLAFGPSCPPFLSRHTLQKCYRPQIFRHQHRPTCSATARKHVVFLGTPSVAANVLQKLSHASKDVNSTFSIDAVVTQPPAPTGRKRILTKSPVHKLAEELSIPSIFTPSTAKEQAFLNALSALSPDLCITAAYGNFLPTAFLKLPRHGTINIHPSLLPAFRGAAPVPRALEAGVKVTGVSLLYTVLKMDAGPLLTSRTHRLEGNEQAPALLEDLFDEGTDALLETMPSVWDGSIKTVEQDHDQATHAAKLSKEEARLTFTENALIVHNKVRAFSGWPGTWADFELRNGDKLEQIRLKILRTVVLREKGGMCLGVHEVSFDDDKACLDIICDDGSKIGVVEVQPPGKKAMDARSFWNGLQGRSIERKRVPH